ncbi:MAG: hypothetical protein D6822_07075, partial [Cyanobacteria bacterium J149]
MIDQVTEQQRSRLSKFLTLILRHQPHLVDMTLDTEGWSSISVVELAERIAQSSEKLNWVTEEIIEEIVQSDPKNRYEIKDSRIRATYGHSVSINPLEFPDDPEDLPEYAYYGGSAEEIETMLRLGLV